MANDKFNRSVLFDVANITILAFTVRVFLTLVLVNSPRSIISVNLLDVAFEDETAPKLK